MPPYRKIPQPAQASQVDVIEVVSTRQIRFHEHPHSHLQLFGMRAILTATLGITDGTKGGICQPRPTFSSELSFVMFSSIITRIFEMVCRLNLNAKIVHGRRQFRSLFTRVAHKGCGDILNEYPRKGFVL